MNAVIKQNLGWGLLSRFPPFRYFPNFLTSPKYMLAIEYHIHTWQVSPQLSCGDTCQIWMGVKVCNKYFCEIENFAHGEIDERSFINPYPRSGEAGRRPRWGSTAAGSVSRLQWEINIEYVRIIFGSHLVATVAHELDLNSDWNINVCSLDTMVFYCPYKFNLMLVFYVVTL